MNTRSLLVKGSTLRVADMGLGVIVGFLMMPFVIGTLGDRWYGVWVLASSLTSYYGLLGLGLSTAVSRLSARAASKHDVEELSRIASTSLVIYSAIGATVAIIGCVAATFVGHVLESEEERSALRIVILLVSAEFSLSMPARAFGGLLSGALRYDLLTAVTMARRIVGASLKVAALMNGWGIVGLAVVTLVVGTGSYLATAILAVREYPQVKISVSKAKKATAKGLIGYGLYAFISQVADLLRFRIDAFVVAGFVGVSSVTIYAIAARLVSYFLEFMVRVLGVLTPLFSRYEGRNDFERLRDVFLTATKVSVVLTVYAVGCAILFGNAFVERWMGPEYRDAAILLAILIVAIGTDVMQKPTTSVLYGISKHRVYAALNVCEGVSNLFLSLFLVQEYGVIGVAIGTAVPMIFIKIFVQPMYVCRAIGLPLSRYSWAVGRNVAIGATAMGALAFAVSDLVVDDYLVILSLGAGIGVVYFSVVPLLVFSRRDISTLAPSLAGRY
jgi:O-antigen/teichoic acid export membrane protein